jgi:hypothetical protein
MNRLGTSSASLTLNNFLLSVFILAVVINYCAVQALQELRIQGTDIIDVLFDEVCFASIVVGFRLLLYLVL